MLNFDELHLLGIKCFHLFGIPEGKINGQNDIIEDFSFPQNIPLPVRTFTSEKSTVEKNLSLIRNFGWVSFNRPGKFLQKYSVHLLKVLGNGVLTNF